MSQVKIVVESEFVGFNSGWPTRYIGLITELYKKHQLTIFAPGDTSLFKKLFPESSICAKTDLPTENNTISRFNLFKELIFPSRNKPLKSIFPYCPKLHEIIKQDPNIYNVSIYFGRNSFVYYGEEDCSSNILCDFCDSFLRHLYNELSNTQSIHGKLGIIFDIFYARRFKKKYFTPNITILSITKKDSSYISSVLSKNMVYTIPNGIKLQDIDYKSDLLKKKYISPYIIFIGSLDYEPNIKSILFSLENLWPEIHAKFPEMIFRIVGRSPAQRLKRVVKDINGVELVGPVKSVEEYYLNAKCFLGPIFSGGGLKNKFLESINTGTPVITTSEGSFGIGMVSKKHGIIAQTKSDLIGGTLELLSCSEREYFQYVNENLILAKEYSWEKVGELFDRIL